MIATDVIIAGNKLIDAFMGVNRVKGYGNKNNGFSYVQSIKYHDDWEWLMPVCKNTGEIQCNIDLKNKGTEYMYLRNKIFKGLQKFNKEETYLAVLDFIKWYNLNK